MNPFALCTLLVSATACAGTPMDSQAPGPPPPGAPTLALETVAGGLSSPLDLTAPPGDQSRLFVAEQTGAIRIIENGMLLPLPFLDLSGVVSCCGERGLLGIAFPPDYATTGRLFVSYTKRNGDSRIASFTVSAGDPNVADPGSEAVILEVSQPFGNHNGGGIVFGPDGMLYIGFGDGGSGGDPQGNGQDRTDLLGSILRIDVSGSAPYAIPADNPYAGHATFRQELWNYGLRNPWRFSFDRQTGDLYIGDVGQNRREEIDVQPAASAGGENYGWNTMEGLECYNATSCDQTDLVLPVLDYGHGGGACSVTGGYVYRGSAIPALAGTYFYADYCAGWVNSFRWDGAAATEQIRWDALAPGDVITSFGQDADGELYVIGGGTVFRIVEQTSP